MRFTLGLLHRHAFFHSAKHHFEGPWRNMKETKVLRRADPGCVAAEVLVCNPKNPYCIFRILHDVYLPTPETPV